MKKIALNYIKLTDLLSFKTIFQIVEQHSGGKWLIHSTKYHKDNQLQSMQLTCRISR